MIARIEKINERFSKVTEDDKYDFSPTEQRILGWSTALAATILALGLYFATT